jgi:hypothetical protein
MLGRKKAESKTPHFLSLNPRYCGLLKIAKVWIKVCYLHFQRNHANFRYKRLTANLTE